jgi:hypothetical protein
MNTLETNAPLGQVYELQSTTQGTLLAEVVSSPGTSGNTFTDSVSTTGSTFDPLVAPLTNAPPAFVGLVVTGYVSVSWTNNESADAVGNVVVTFEVSLDSGVTFNSIGDPVIASAFNPSTAPSQQFGVVVPVVFRTASGPATGNVICRASFVDQGTETTLASVEMTVAGVYTPA